MYEEITIDLDGNKIISKENEEGAWEMMRGIRNSLLLESDLYALNDRWNSFTEEQQEELTIYRQALRDLPDNIGAIEDIWDMEFPIPPSFIDSMHN